MNNLEKYGIEQTHCPETTKRRHGGVSPKTMGTVNGEKVLIKSATFSGDDRMTFAEYFVSKLGNAIGVNVNRVELADCGDILGLPKRFCSIHYWEDDFIIADNLDTCVSSEDEAVLNFFDEIICNSDRHGENYGMLDGELFCIDHGFAKPWRGGVSEYWLEDYLKDDRTAHIVENLLSLSKSDFENMVKVPESFEHDIEPEVLEETVIRMLKVQRIIMDIKEEIAA